MNSINTNDMSTDFIDYHEVIECIASALDAKDTYTADHSKRVSDMATIIGTLMELKKEDIEKIHIAAHLHDIGKIGVPDNVLNKKGKLDASEWEFIKAHPITGANILNKSSKLSELSDIVLYHHERYNGTGYPYGLSGVHIPLGARIITICDSIDAMTTKRSYREAFDYEYAYEEIEKNLGIMYDPFIGKFVLDNWSRII